MSANEIIDVTYLRELVERSGRTHQEIARAVQPEIRRQTVTEILNLDPSTEKTVKTATLHRMARALGVPVWSLFVGAPRDRAA
jgi:L-alanine-DL-glutamate epimerase-like enolase superfamily enzyme